MGGTEGISNPVDRGNYGGGQGGGGPLAEGQKEKAGRGGGSRHQDRHREGHGNHGPPHPEPLAPSSTPLPIRARSPPISIIEIIEIGPISIISGPP